MFTSCSWTQTSKPAKIGINGMCLGWVYNPSYSHFGSTTFPDIPAKKTCSLGITRERGHFEHEFLDNPLVISKTNKEKDDSYKGHSIPHISFWIPEKSIFSVF
jgi:hypothetical protein